jgi:hypothetical protein
MKNIHNVIVKSINEKIFSIIYYKNIEMEGSQTLSSEEMKGLGLTDEQIAKLLRLPPGYAKIEAAKMQQQAEERAAEERAAASKIAAVQRGKQDRARVAAMKAEKQAKRRLAEANERFLQSETAEQQVLRSGQEAIAAAREKLPSGKAIAAGVGATALTGAAIANPEKATELGKYAVEKAGDTLSGFRDTVGNYMSGDNLHDPPPGLLGGRKRRSKRRSRRRRSTRRRYSKRRRSTKKKRTTKKKRYSKRRRSTRR